MSMYDDIAASHNKYREPQPCHGCKKPVGDRDISYSIGKLKFCAHCIDRALRAQFDICGD